MDFIKPKNINKENISWKISRRTKLIVEYYAKYTEYEEDEVVDMFLQNILKDKDFVEWLGTRRSKKKIDEIIFSKDNKEVANNESIENEVDFQITKLKELANETSLDVSTVCPYADKELKQMDKNYNALSATSFGKKYRYLVFEPSHLKEQSKISSIQMNHCNNPFCKWFGLPQQKFENIKSKPSRYKLVGGGTELVYNIYTIVIKEELRWERYYVEKVITYTYCTCIFYFINSWMYQFRVQGTKDK